MRAVARKVGVTERTVHRHFEGRDALVRAVWRAMLRELVGTPALPETADDLVERPKRRFPRYSRQRELMRSFVHSRASKELLTRANSEHQRATVACIENELAYVDEGGLRRRAAAIQVLASPYAWDFMQGLWGFSGEEAGEAAAEAIEILLNRRPPF